MLWIVYIGKHDNDLGTAFILVQKNKNKDKRVLFHRIMEL